VTVIQRFGGGLNLNLHFHTLLFDGVFFAEGTEGALAFRPLPPPTDDEVGVVLARIAARVPRLLKRRGLDPGDADLFQADPVVEESPALAGISSASIQGRIALGPRAGGRVGRVGFEPVIADVNTLTEIIERKIELGVIEGETFEVVEKRVEAAICVKTFDGVVRGCGVFPVLEVIPAGAR